MKLLYLIHMTSYSRFFVALLVGCVFSPSLSAQGTISGRVIDAENERPLTGANVFLSNTTFGAASDSTGHFAIVNVPPGSYELITSYVGYEPQKMLISFRPSQEHTLTIRLRPRPIQVGEVVVIEADPREWRDNLGVFQRTFFGVKSLSKQCRILNPEFLDFQYDREKGLFQASARGPIQFVNDYLGYVVTVVLEQFEAQLFHGYIYVVERAGTAARFRRGQLKLTATAQFAPQSPSDSEQLELWKRNRLQTYRGSLRHFLTALTSGDLETEGFRIYLMKSMQERESFQASPKDILRPGRFQGEMELAIPDLLKVVYDNARDDVQFEIELEKIRNMDVLDIDLATERAEKRTASQQSWLRIINGTAVTITTNGIVLPSNAKLSAYGYWSWDSPAEWLPSGYMPVSEQ